MRRWLIGFLGLAMLAAAPLPLRADDALYPQLQLFSETITLVERAYVDEVEGARLMEGAVAGVLDVLGPHAMLIPAGEPERSEPVRVAAWRTSGMSVTQMRGVAYAMRVIPGGAADRAGIRRGDVLVQIDGRPTRTMSRWQIRKLLAGPRGRSLPLSWLREGEFRETFIDVEAIAIPPIEIRAAEDVTIVRIPEIGLQTASALRALLAEIHTPRLLIDLREGGGTAALAYEVSETLATGELGTLRDASGPLHRFEARQPPAWTGERVAVLVDRGTVDAAEILAAILRQRLGAALVGQQTFGWSGQQALVSLSSGSQLWMTVAFYTGPDGEHIHRGLAPDLELFPGTDADEVLRRGLEVVRESAP